ncbi:MAG: hypothetical protein IPO69_00335 [Saprospiraceae bacterium]|nr:hypothetical protein [Saprospiraceae bacterium]
MSLGLACKSSSLPLCSALGPEALTGTILAITQVIHAQGIKFYDIEGWTCVAGYAIGFAKNKAAPSFHPQSWHWHHPVTIFGRVTH